VGGGVGGAWVTGPGQGGHARSAAAPATAISSGPSVCMTLANMSNGVFRELASTTDRSMPPSSSIIFTTPLRTAVTQEDEHNNDMLTHICCN
jgi:hypothetical protein